MPRRKAQLDVPVGLTTFDRDDARRMMTDVIHSALEDTTRKAYMCTYRDYKSFCARLGYSGKATTESIGMFLMAKSKAVGNAASFAQWKTHITRTAHKLGELDPDGVDTKLLSELEWACGKLYGHASTQCEPWGSEELQQVWDRVRPSPSKDLKEYSIFVQAVVTMATMGRPGDLGGPQCVARVGDISFVDADDELPFGGIDIMLHNSKKMRLTGKHGKEHMLAMGVGNEETGGICPVTHLRRLMAIHDLGSEPKAFIFAKIRGDGSRHTDKAITLGQYNSGLKKLFARAGLPEPTARGSRPGRRTELGAQDALDSVVTTLGRWYDYMSGRPYSRQCPALLKHLAKVLGVVAPQQAAPPPPQLAITPPQPSRRKRQRVE